MAQATLLGRKNGNLGDFGSNFLFSGGPLGAGRHRGRGRPDGRPVRASHQEDAEVLASRPPVVEVSGPATKPVGERRLRPGKRQGLPLDGGS